MLMAKNEGVVRKKAILIDVDYKIRGGKTMVRLLMKGKHFFRLYDNYEPYFYCDTPYDVPHVSGAIIAMKHPCYENNIPFGRRYLIDRGLSPFTRLTYEREGKFLKKMLKKNDAAVQLKTMAYD